MCKFISCLFTAVVLLSDLLLSCPGVAVITTAQFHSTKVYTQVEQSRLKSCLRRVKDSQWWESLTMVTAGNKAKRFSSVNHTQKQFIIIIIKELEYNTTVVKAPEIKLPEFTLATYFVYWNFYWFTGQFIKDRNIFIFDKTFRGTTCWLFSKF